jgi:hypothetical protein
VACGWRETCRCIFCSNGTGGTDCHDDVRMGSCRAFIHQGWADFCVMTSALCAVQCTGFKYVGVQDGAQCFCGSDCGNQGGKAPGADCHAPCAGDSNIMCGGSWRGSIYTQPPTAPDPINAHWRAWFYRGGAPGRECPVFLTHPLDAGAPVSLVLHCTGYH